MNEPTVTLVPHSPAHLRAMMEGPDHYERSFGHKPADGLRDFLVSDDASPEYMEKMLAGDAADPWTHGFGVVHAESGEVIGFAGFKGPPADGVVEIAYGIVPNHQGKGHATVAARALVEFAERDDRVRIIWAHTLPEVNASTRVLTKCGFTHIGEVVDPEDGPVWRWELTV